MVSETQSQQSGKLTSEFKKRVPILCLALAVGLGLPLYCGLVSPGPALYSDSLPLRWQVEAFLKGRIALDTTPWGMGWDLAWGNGNVQQVLGLGVPVWRLPFELIARAVGVPAFPDRLCFVVALILTAYWILRFGTGQRFNLPFVYVGLLTTVLFPPFIALCCSRFLVYEEVVAYGFLAALALAFGLARWITAIHRDDVAAASTTVRQKPGCGYLALGAASGLMPFIRPTMVFYGGAAVGVAAFVAWRRGLRLPAVVSGLAVYCLLIGTLLWSNNQRFGSPFEFGHSLNLNGLAPMRYASRFDHPYQDESLVSAVRELGSILFFTKEFLVPSNSGYEPDLFKGQSSTFRWREIYFSTFGPLELVFVLGAWGRALWRLKRHRGVALSEPTAALGLWSLLSTLPLFGFYLRFPFLSSRYLMDFAPGLAVGAWVLWSLLMNWAQQLKYRSMLALAVCFVCLLGWWGYAATSVWNTEGGQEHTLGEVLKQMERDRKRLGDTKLPEEYTNAVQRAGIPLNLNGWLEDGRTLACVAAFVKDPDCLVLELAPAGEAVLPLEAYECIRAKIGLELLARENVMETTNGVQLVFAGPKNTKYQQGYQLAFVALMPRKELSDRESRFRLLRIAWWRDRILHSTAAEPGQTAVGLESHFDK